MVVPATARLIGSYAAGISSDLLTSILLATHAPVLLCPAMHTEMWEHPAVQDNLALLRRRGVHVLEPADGRLAGGDYGKGRLREPEEVVAALEAVLSRGAVGGADHTCGPGREPSRGVKAVVSAGGTREPLDPVRYIGNRSSGKQGYAVAAELQGRGAQVVLVTSSPLSPPAGVEVIEVETAAEMAESVLGQAAGADVVVMAAAVADYRPSDAASAKIKKSNMPHGRSTGPDPGHPGRAGCPQARGPGRSRLRSGNGTRRRPRRAGTGQARFERGGPDRGQRCER